MDCKCSQSACEVNNAGAAATSCGESVAPPASQSEKPPASMSDRALTVYDVVIAEIGAEEIQASWGVRAEEAPLDCLSRQLGVGQHVHARALLLLLLLRICLRLELRAAVATAHRGARRPIPVLRRTSFALALEGGDADR
jgi:hypothetical protein